MKIFTTLGGGSANSQIRRRSSAGSCGKSKNWSLEFEGKVRSMAIVMEGVEVDFKRKGTDPIKLE